MTMNQAYAEALIRRDWHPVPMDEASFRDWLRLALNKLPAEVIAAEFYNVAALRAYDGDSGWVWTLLGAISARMAEAETVVG